MEKESVADFWLGKAGQLAILWTDGRFLLPGGKFAREKVSMIKKWNLIEQISPNKFILVGYKKLKVI